MSKSFKLDKNNQKANNNNNKIENIPSSFQLKILEISY